MRNRSELHLWCSQRKNYKRIDAFSSIFKTKVQLAGMDITKIDSVNFWTIMPETGWQGTSNRVDTSNLLQF
jgi:hypothetical protein